MNFEKLAFQFGFQKIPKRYLYLGGDMSRNLSRLVTVILGVLVASTCQAHGNGNEYTFTDLGANGLGGTLSHAEAINDNGQVAGYASTAGNVVYHAARWDGGVATDLGLLGGSSSQAHALNNSEQVVGGAYITGNSAVHAALWNGSSVTDLGTLGGDYSAAYAINNSGQVVGWAWTSDGSLRATLWNGSTPTNLGTLGGPNSYAFGINDAGQIVGGADITDNAVSHAVLWDGNTAIDLGAGASGGTFSHAFAINNAGQVVGFAYTTGNAISHATLWNGTIATDLGSLGGAASQALAINNVGQVVGYATTQDGTQHAALWNVTNTPHSRSCHKHDHPDGNKCYDTDKSHLVTLRRINTVTDINSFLDASVVSAGWVLMTANGINDNGWIVGDAYNSKTGATTAYLLSLDNNEDFRHMPE